MIRVGGLVRTVLGLCVAASLAAQQPGSVTAPAAAKPFVAAPLAPIGIMLDRIVAVVGQTPILLSDVVDAAYYLKGAGDAVPDPTDSVAFQAYLRDRLDDLINQDVLIAVAKQYKAEVDDKDITPDVDKRLKDLHARFKSDADFRAQLKAESFGSETELRNSLLDKRRNDLLQQMAMDSLRAHGKLAAPVNVTEAQITAAFEKAKTKVGKRPATISFKQIVVAPKANPAARAAAKAKADSLLLVLQRGGDFETIGPDCPRQAARDAQSLQRNNPAVGRIDQEHRLIDPRVGHRENPAPIAVDQIVRGEGGRHGPYPCAAIHRSSQWMS